MNQYLENRKTARSIYAFVGLFALFVISGINSCTEIRYALTSRTAEARITKRTKPIEDHGKLIGGIYYAFKAEDGKAYEGKIKVDMNRWTEPAGGKFTVAYLGGDPSTSRPAGVSGKASIVIFLVILTVFVGWCAYSYWLAKEGRID